MITGVDALLSIDAITVGDAYEAPSAIRRVFPNICVVLLHASHRTIVQRIRAKRMSSQEKQARLETVEREFQSGFPRDVRIHDYVLSTERALDITGIELLSQIRKHQSGLVEANLSQRPQI